MSMKVLGLRVFLGSGVRPCIGLRICGGGKAFIPEVLSPFMSHGHEWLFQVAFATIALPNQNQKPCTLCSTSSQVFLKDSLLYIEGYRSSIAPAWQYQQVSPDHGIS